MLTQPFQFKVNVGEKKMAEDGKLHQTDKTSEWPQVLDQSVPVWKVKVQK